jgi:hypothetical protein
VVDDSGDAKDEAALHRLVRGGDEREADEEVPADHGQVCGRGFLPGVDEDAQPVRPRGLFERDLVMMGTAQRYGVVGVGGGRRLWRRQGW